MQQQASTSSETQLASTSSETITSDIELARKRKKSEYNKQYRLKKGKGGREAGQNKRYNFYL